MGQRGPGVPRLPRRSGRDLARPRPPRGGRRRGRAGPHAAPRVEPLLQRRPAEAGRRAQRAPRRRRAGLLLQLRRRGQRVRHQAGPPLRPEARHHAHVPRRVGPQLVPRPDAHDPGRHRPAGEAGGLPAAGAGLLAGALRRRRRPRGAGRAVRGEAGRHPPRGGPGRGRGVAGAARLPAGRAGAVRPVGGTPHARRGADRPRADGQVVRLRALRRPARHRHHGQGAGQRRADRRLLGHRRGGLRLRARRPRHHLRRAAAGRPGRAHHGADHAARERAGAGRPGRRPPGGGTGGHARRERRPGARPAAGRRAGRRHRLQGGRRRLPGRGLVVNAVTASALRFEPSLLVTDDEIDEAVAIVGKALA